jgi:hypothetical protein
MSLEDSVCVFLGGGAYAVAVFVLALLFVAIWAKLRHHRTSDRTIGKDLGELFMLMLVPLVIAGGLGTMLVQKYYMQ